MHIEITRRTPFQIAQRFAARDYGVMMDRQPDYGCIMNWLLLWELETSRYQSSEITFEKTDHYTSKEYKMAKAANDKKNDKKDNWKGFINVPLTDEDKSKISSAWQKAKYPEIVAFLADTGKMSVSFNPQNQTFNCSVVFYHDALAGFCVSSFAPTPVMAMYITFYKLDVYGDTLQPEDQQTNRPAFG